MLRDKWWKIEKRKKKNRIREAQTCFNIDLYTGQDYTYRTVNSHAYKKRLKKVKLW